MRSVQSSIRSNGQRPWVKRLGRLGYAAKAVLYLVIGLLALRLALGDGGSTTDAKGALQYLATLPFGGVMLWLMCVGLLGLVAWRAIQMFVESPHKEAGAKRWIHRGGLFVSAVTHAALLVGTLRLLTSGRSSGGNEARDWTARIMDVPFGRAAIAVAGLVVLAFGVREIWSAWKQGFQRKLALNGLAARKSHWVTRTSQFGLAARGTVFALMGGFLVQAALTHDPSEARGIGETLTSISTQPFGVFLLGIVALGLMAYAAYALVQARYRRMPAN